MPFVALIIEQSGVRFIFTRPSSELLLPEVFLKYSQSKRPKLTVILLWDEVKAVHFDFDRCKAGITVTAKQA